MSHIESPTQTLLKFDQNEGWKNSSKKVLTADFLSANGESNLLWTPFHYEERDGKLYDPVREQFVAGSANGDTVEENVISQLQEWFLNHDSGIGVWISPRGNGKRPYYDEQITIYRIAYKNIDSDHPLQKVLMFSWHQFKTEFRNPEEIRRFVFTEDDKEESVFELINWLKGISEKPIANDCGDLKERRIKAEHYVDLYKSNTSMYDLAYQMDQTQFLGKNPIGCTSFNSTQNQYYYSNITDAPIYSTADAGDGKGPLRVICPKCSTENTRPFGGYVHRCRNEDCPDPTYIACGK